ncbi:MAG: class I SAM-dependent methyltransferase [Acidobacteria bacterium]|nr:class I SAM-dependent methyltransferase [Acidobacteriota bacterium]
MSRQLQYLVVVLCVLLAVFFSTSLAEDQKTPNAENIDKQVQKFLDSHRWSWRDANVPEVDGKALYDIILQHGYKNALEIGTSTGHSTVWIAWALSKTGGKLITIEIDKYKRDQALAHFKEAGVAEYIDSRLADAHELVSKLEGPFDFVFCDADKDWYKNYLEAVEPKLSVDGCFAAHNVFEVSNIGSGGGRGREGYRGGFGRGFGGGGGYWVGDFLEYVRSFSNLETKVLDLQGSNGLCVSYKKAEK